MPRLRLTFSPSAVLRQKNQDLIFPLKKEFLELIDQMIFACKKFRGIGLAAPQVGRSLNLAIVNLEPYDLPAFPIINPKILRASRETDTMEEGCLSIPDMFGKVTRPTKIKVEFYDRGGKRFSLDLEGLAAKVFQHEIDHLHATLISDKWIPASVHKDDVSKTRSLSERAREKSPIP